MNEAVKSETVALFQLWKDNRASLPSFGTTCRLARSGAVPGVVSAKCGTPEVLTTRAIEAIQALQRAEHERTDCGTT